MQNNEKVLHSEMENDIFLNLLDVQTLLLYYMFKLCYLKHSNTLKNDRTFKNALHQIEISI